MYWLRSRSGSAESRCLDQVKCTIRKRLCECAAHGVRPDGGRRRMGRRLFQLRGRRHSSEETRVSAGNGNETVLISFRFRLWKHFARKG